MDAKGCENGPRALVQPFGPFGRFLPSLAEMTLSQQIRNVGRKFHMNLIRPMTSENGESTNRVRKPANVETRSEIGQGYVWLIVKGWIVEAIKVQQVV